MKSMTGFGRGSAVAPQAGIAFTVEITSINRKQMDVRVSLPPEFSSFEPLLRQILSEKISRGSVGIKVSCRYEGQIAAIRLNAKLLEQLMKETVELQRQLGLPKKAELQDFFALPGVVETAIPDNELTEIRETLEKAMRQALEAISVMQQQEGANLRTDISARLTLLRQMVDQVEPKAADIPRLQRDRLLQRLREADLGLDCNDERVLRELVIFSDKADITEEITRLRSHFDQFEGYMNAGRNDTVGRSLDFLVQEINRELTTLGNKAAGAEISPLVVRMKTEAEKIREQIQNVE